MDTAKTECQAFDWNNKGEILCKTHHERMWYACAALIHHDWNLDVTNKAMFADVILKLIANIIETMKEFYQWNHQDKLLNSWGDYVEEIERSYMKIK